MGVCFFAFIDSTWKDAIWDFTSFDYSGDNPWRFGRFIVDSIFLIIIVQVVSQMFTGIITDQFANFREKMQEIKDDLASQCFICGKSATEIEKLGESFINHSMKRHHFMNYAFYMDYLKKKLKFCSESMTNEEKYVVEIIKQKDAE